MTGDTDVAVRCAHRNLRLRRLPRRPWCTSRRAPCVSCG